MVDDTLEERHKRRMIRKKQVIDASISQATEKKGLILVLTGNGKGKSSSAFGMVARALGHDLKAAVFQFIKGSGGTGEQRFFTQNTDVIWHECGEGFTWETQSRERDIKAAEAGWVLAKKALTDPKINLIVLDEMTYLFNYHYLSLEDVIMVLKNRPPLQHVVITGRGAPQALINLADTVSEIKDEKHAFRAGITAQPGIDL